MEKKKMFILAALLVLLTAGIGGYLFFRKVPASVGGEKGTADGASALLALKELSGESRVDTLADIKAAAKEDVPETYLATNSVYVMDEVAVERVIQSYLTGAESTAGAFGMTNEELIVGEWGYESTEAYREHVAEELERFIKQRLAIYEMARDRRISINEREYEEQLLDYAERYGYDDAFTFTFECTPSSIANEMLYDKTLQEIKRL